MRAVPQHLWEGSPERSRVKPRYVPQLSMWKRLLLNAIIAFSYCEISSVIFAYPCRSSKAGNGRGLGMLALEDLLLCTSRSYRLPGSLAFGARRCTWDRETWRNCAAFWGKWGLYPARVRCDWEHSGITGICWSRFNLTNFIKGRNPRLPSSLKPDIWDQFWEVQA